MAYLCSDSKEIYIKCDVHAAFLFCLFSLLSPAEQSFHFSASLRAVSFFSSESQYIESVCEGQVPNPQGTTGIHCLNFIFLHCLL